jgi:starch-binding outer membrane protein, SusD/RagB family
MKLSKKQALTGLVLMAVAGYGCQDFLVAPPQGALDELVLADRAGLEATLIGAYRPIGSVHGWEAAPSNWPYGSITSDDAYKGSEASDQPAANFLELYDWAGGGAHSYLNNKWSTVYEGVSRSNATLRLLNRVLLEKPGELSEANANGIRGETLFLRAHYHFEAWRIWGNIPYYTEEDTDFRKPNTGDPLPMILADLDEAIRLLPVTSRFGHRGRVNQWTARAYKGRVQVSSGDYTGGLASLGHVEQNGPYALEENFHRVWTGF